MQLETWNSKMISGFIISQHLWAFYSMWITNMALIEWQLKPAYSETTWGKTAFVPLSVTRCCIIRVSEEGLCSITKAHLLTVWDCQLIWFFLLSSSSWLYSRWRVWSHHQWRVLYIIIGQFTVCYCIGGKLKFIVKL